MTDDSASASLLAIPDKLVVLTFDDGHKSDFTFVAPMLQRYGFGATFFVTEGLDTTDKTNFLTWEEIRALDEAGFDIGSHSASHPDMPSLSKEEMRGELEHIERRCQEHGVRKPTSFGYPGGGHSLEAVEVLTEAGYRFARYGVTPEYYDSGGSTNWGSRGIPYDPSRDHPMLVPTTVLGGVDLPYDEYVWGEEQAKDGKIAVLTFHGLPSIYPWVVVERRDFARLMKYLHDHQFTVISLRDLDKYVDPMRRPEEPYAAIDLRLRVTPAQLKCEYAVDPLGLDMAQPRFSWVPQSYSRGQSQSAYEVLVASSRDLLDANTADRWDSGKIESDQSIHVVYEGKPLASGERCWWKVRLWDKDGEASPYNEPASFEMGLLSESDWQGEWIGMGAGEFLPKAERDQPSSKGDETEAAPPSFAPVLRKEFNIEKEVVRGRVYISGLGWHELLINGRKVGDHVLDPAATNYDKRLLYVTHDITDQLHKGQNAVGVLLAGGWYTRNNEHAFEGFPYGEQPKLLLQMNLEFADGTSTNVVSDETWKISRSPITACDLCAGETYDARLDAPGWDRPGYDDSAWDSPREVTPPEGKLVSQSLPPITVVDTIPPVGISQPEPDIYIYDFGQQLSGWAKLRVRGPRGTEVKLRFAQELYDSGHLDDRANLGTAQTDTYLLKGNGEEVWEPRFTLHGFRYVEVTGFPGTPTRESLQARFVRSAVESSGRFACSNPLLNQIHSNARWTLMSSFQGIPQDAAERDERVAWLGDPGFVAEDYIYNYDTASFWSKWLDDISDSQAPSGEVPWVSPSRCFYLDPAWHSTYPLFVWYLYQYYGDQRVLERHYAGLAGLLAFLGEQARDHLISAGIGDHMEPQPDGSCSFESVHTRAVLTSTAYYYFDAWIMAQAAEVLGKREDAGRYSELAESIKVAFNREFFDESTNQYDTGSQTSNAMALYLRLVPEGREGTVLENLVTDILVNHLGHPSTGIIGTNALEQVLPEYGRADVMYAIASQTTFPSWGYQIGKGATAIWEQWDDNPGGCRNMKMFCSSEKFFYEHLAGIALAAPGFKQIAIRPQVVGDLTHASASLMTVHGLVEVRWERSADAFELRVTIPANTTAQVSLPKLGRSEIAVTEGRIPVWQEGNFVPGVAGITTGAETQDSVVLDVGSGSYSFRLSEPSGMLRVSYDY